MFVQTSLYYWQLDLLSCKVLDYPITERNIHYILEIDTDIKLESLGCLGHPHQLQLCCKHHLRAFESVV